MLRGVTAAALHSNGSNSDDISADVLNHCRAGPTAMIISDATDHLCEQASIDGVLIVPHITLSSIPAGSSLGRELARLARWPAVGLVIIAEDIGTIDAARLKQGNLLLAQAFTQDAPVRPAAWADAVVAPVDSPTVFATAVGECRLPVIAYRPRTGLGGDVAAGRAACDHLQCDLARHGDFAGYVV